MLSFFPRDVLDEILNLIESVSEGFPSYSFSPRRGPPIEFRGVRQMGRLLLGNWEEIANIFWELGSKLSECDFLNCFGF